MHLVARLINDFRTEHALVRLILRLRNRSLSPSSSSFFFSLRLPRTECLLFSVVSFRVRGRHYININETLLRGN